MICLSPSLVFFCCVLLVTVTVLAPVEGSAGSPEAVRISFGGHFKDNTVSNYIVWTTFNTTGDSSVSFGTSEDALTSTARGVVRSYWPGTYFHSVELLGLTPDTVYYYRVANLEDVFQFKSLASADSSSGFTFAYFADMGLSNSEDTRAQLEKRLDEYEFIVDGGDLAYADDRKQKNYEAVYNEWQREMQPLTSAKQFMVCPGNHDVSCDSVTGAIGCNPAFDNFTAYNSRFTMPSEYSEGVMNMWYAFSYSIAQFVMIDTETDYHLAPEGRHTQYRAGGFGDQMGWLDNQLAAAAAERDRRGGWLVVVGHRPLYAIPYFDWPPDAKKTLRDAVEDMFLKYKVDLYLCGHSHTVSAYWPMANGNITQKSYDSPPSPVYYLAGNAGNIEGHDPAVAKNGPDYGPARFFNAFEYGYSLIDVKDEHSLTIRTFRATDDALLDQFTITK